MNYKCEYDPLARSEFKNALAWYLEKSELAANNFINEVEETIKIICASPLRYLVVKKFRETSLKKFPYSIVYSVNGIAKTILSVSIYHHKRNPRKKYRSKKR